jgi:hypothetical protein
LRAVGFPEFPPGVAIRHNSKAMRSRFTRKHTVPAARWKTASITRNARRVRVILSSAFAYQAIFIAAARALDSP